MDICDECGVEPASIHLTKVSQNKTMVFHLCEKCAKMNGINISVQDESFQELIKSKEDIEPDISCTNCGMKYSEFRAKGWLGCSSCYSAFEKEIDELLVQVHGSSVHKGKQYKRTSFQTEISKGEMKRLRHELAIAVKNEAFEHAAKIRDAIHSLKKMGVE